MNPAYILHHSSCKDRRDLVSDVVNKTRATIVESYWLPNDGLRGNSISHVLVAKLAQSQHPDKHYLVFEDDCVLSEDWAITTQDLSFADVVYIGYTNEANDIVFGTHALMISPKARDKIIQWTETLGNKVHRKNAFDHILSLLCRQEGLVVCKPKFEVREKYARQKKGIKSYITGQIR